MARHAAYRTALAWLLAAPAIAVLAGACGDEPAGMGRPLVATHDAGTPGPQAGSPPPASDASTAGRGGAGGVGGAMDAGPSVGDAAADAGTDAATPDGGSDAGAASDGPQTLAETGLFASGSDGALAPGVVTYSPAYVLWADDAQKERWFYLPEGEQIDTSDMDYWAFPVGTKAWKLFSLDGKKLETRLLWKTELGWVRMAFAWNDAETEALAVPNGALDVRGTAHDIPKRGACGDCHDGVPDVLLGISAVQLSHAGAGMTLTSLMSDGRLSAPPAGDFALPATDEWNALGYMHANCGHCHNPRSIAFDRLDLDLWLRTDQLDAVTSTESYKTTVGIPLSDTSGALSLRVASGDGDMSGLIERMETRGSDLAMPPLASEDVDTDGVTAIRAWIDTLP